MVESSASWWVDVRVELKPGILDAEAENIHKTLGLLGIAQLSTVTTARIYSLRFDGVSQQQALELAGRAVDQLLANPVVHRVVVSPRSS
jgi:phosphoribosylformylglycinamidine synthase PurS subunit